MDGNMKLKYKARCGIFLSILILFSTNIIASERKDEPAEVLKISPQTEACIACHKMYTPGIVEDWLSSRHSKTTPSDAMKKPFLQKRISVENNPPSPPFSKGGMGGFELSEYVVGCYECHSQNQEMHKDNFEHMGNRINVVVTPNDCKTCHPVEFKQFSSSKKANAIRNLMENPVYHTLVKTINGTKKVEGEKIISEKPSDMTLNETCLGCHGTKVEVRGMKKLPTRLGEITIPELTNWPNQGVGRGNPDGSFGACTACHPRHGFSIEVARKPYTCAQCHLEPDVPAWNVYKESKHGNIFFSKYHEWDFNSVPWVVGKDIKAPTCATCHNSLLVSPDGNVIAERSHDFGSRLWVRIFGLIYSHPQPKLGDTTIINNKDGVPLPTTFTGEPAAQYLIEKAEQDKRLDRMQSICKGCHSADWANRHFTKFENTLKETNEMTLTATNLILETWTKGIEDKTNPFDETIEQMWIKQWLFYSNSIRYASAMTGAPDYATFKFGWWDLTNNLMKMQDAIETKKLVRKKK